jgi:hypothetical protein
MTLSKPPCPFFLPRTRCPRSRAPSLDAMAHPRCVGWGEIGLECHYDNSPRDIQQTIFARQLAHIVRLGKPLTIYTRKAEADTERIHRQKCNRVATAWPAVWPELFRWPRAHLCPPYLFVQIGPPGQHVASACSRGRAFPCSHLLCKEFKTNTTIISGYYT